MPTPSSPPAKPSSSDPASFVEHTLRRYESVLVGYAFTLSRDPDHAREAACETFIRLCRQKPESFKTRGSENPLRSWLFSTCRKLVKPAKKAEIATPPHEIRWTKIAGPKADDTTGAALLARLDELPANQREALVLKCHHELTYDEIATITGLSRGNIAFLVAKGLKRLRQSPVAHS